MNEYRLQFRGTLYPVRSGEITLGRSSYASIVVNNPLASREHAVIRFEQGFLEITDLGSKNGTFLNGQRIVGRARLEVGDVVKIGSDAIEVLRVFVQDQRALRMQTQPGRTAPPLSEGDTTSDFSRSLDLAESLIAGSAADMPPDATAARVQQIVEDYLSSVESVGTGESDRILRIAAIVGNWNLGPPIDEWKSRLETRFSSGRR